MSNINSVLAYPNRGAYGKSNYRGNCSGFIIRDLLQYFKPTTFVDPTLGGGTSMDVVNELNAAGANIEFFGLDLHSGFNLLKDSLTERIGGMRADYVFFHPPYANVISYSSNMWGTEKHPDDLSNCENYEDFLTKMRTSMQNIYDAVRPGKNFSVLIGDLRKNGQYTAIQADLLQIAPGSLDGILIKQQFNCVSDRKTYAHAKFIPIMHEYILNFRKELTVFGILDTSLNISKKLQMLANANWKATVNYALNELGGKAPLQEIYQVIEKSSPEKISTRPNWQARVRRTLQLFFSSTERGVWAIA